MLRSPSLARALIAAALLWHLLAVFTGGWATARGEGHGRDFASYYYAVQVAREGGDPYDKGALEEEARGVRRAVHPYFYPPPFLLLMAWIGPEQSLPSAYHLWFWLDELCLLAAALALWRWWRPLGAAVAPTLAMSLAALSALPNNHLMGQANLPVLALCLAGLALAEPLDRRAGRGRELAGGALVGAACMAKMSPALFVLWWLGRGRWTPVAAAVAAALLLSVLSLPLVGPSTQLRFYTEVLPGFASGTYNGLTVDIGLYGNHSLPNLYDGALPRPGPGLSTGARWLSRLSLLVLAGGLALAWRRRPDRRVDGLARAAQVGAIGLLMLLVPVYTYEHHLVWALPAVVVLWLALGAGRLHPAWAVPVGMAVALWGFELAALKRWVIGYEELPGLALRGAVQESKFVALVALFAAAVVLGRGRKAVGYAPSAEEGADD